MFTLRRMFVPVIGLAALIGCSERDTAPPPLDYNLGTDAEPLMPPPEPKLTSLVLSDQAGYKPLGETALTDKEKTDLVASLGIKEKAAVAGGPAEAGEGEAGKAGELIAKAAGLGDKLKNLLGGKTPGDEETDAPAEPTNPDVIDVADVLKNEARPEMAEVPPNPAGRPSQGIQLAKKAAIGAATKALSQIIPKLPVEVGMSVGETVGNKKALADMLLPNVRAVAMKWVDSDTLEVEAEMAVSDLVEQLKKTFPERDFNAMGPLLEGKFLAATGRGVIPPNMRTTNKALPGERAREAAGGLDE
jgi:hypothetical protein